MAIDGTDVPAWLDQAPDYSASAAHKRVSNRGMTGAAFGTHGRHFWRGYTLLVLTTTTRGGPVSAGKRPGNAAGPQPPRPNPPKTPKTPKT